MYGAVPPLSTLSHGSSDHLRDYHVLKNAAIQCRIKQMMLCMCGDNLRAYVKYDAT
jgi:hypothetical protein